MKKSVSAALIDVSGRGGISHHVFMMGGGLARAGINVTILTTKDCEIDANEKMLHVRRIFRAHHQQRSSLIKGIVYMGSLFRLTREILSQRPDIVHWHECKLPGLERRVISIMQRNGMGIVLSTHDVLHPDKGRVRNALIEWYRQFDRIIAHAEDSKMKISRLSGIKADRIDVVPVGDYSQMVRSGLDRADARKKLDVPLNARVLLFFGYIRKYKGLDLLLEAAARARDSVPGLHIIIAGEPKDDFSIYARMIDHLAISEIVHCDIRYIPLDEVSDYFAASDIVVLPYRNIYQSGLLYMAFAYKKSVIASRVGGVAEVVKHGEHGFLVEPEDVGQLHDTIVQAFSNPEKLERMGTAAFRYAKKVFSWDGIASSLSRIYNDLLAQMNT